jgi:hypothetical protein
MIYPVYSTQAVRWQPLSSIQADKTHAAKIQSSPKLFSAQEKLRQALQEKQWLLEENQHLVVPPSHLDDYQGRIFSMGDFVKRADEARDRDVLETSMDEHGQRRLLSPEQFQQLKQTGELDVPSKLFENQHHTWKVAPGFYSGTDNVRRSFGEGFGKALDHYVVYTSDAVMTKEDHSKLRPTLRKALQNGLGRAVRLLRGAAGQLFAGRLPRRTHSENNIDYLMDEAELAYVLYHLREHDTRCLFDRDAYRTMHSTVDHEKDELWDTLEKDGEFDRKYRQPSEQREAAHEAHQELDSMRDTFDEKMRSMRNLQLNINQAKVLESPLAAIAEAERAENEWLAAKDQAWIDHLKSQTREDVKELGRVEADRLLAQQIEDEVRRKDDEMVVDDLKSYKDSLKQKRPVLSLSSAWTNRKLDAKRLEIEASLESSRVERITQRLEDQDLEVQCTARKLVTEFRRDHRTVLAKRLRSKLSSFPPATFEVLQLNPNHWTFDERNRVKRHKTVKVDLGRPLWRVRYSWMIAVTLTKSMIGGAFHFLTSGPFSLRAFFSPRPYYAVERPVHDERSLTQTLASRLRSFHATLKAVREHFDAEPDTGLIGKSIQSFFLRIYLGLKGTVGSLWIVAFMTVGTIVSSLLSLVVLTLAPVIASTLTVINALFNLTVYDTAIAAALGRGTGSDSEMPSCASPLLKIGLGVPYFLVFPGALQAVFATIRLVVVHPAAGAVCLSWTSLRFAVRSLRDSITWFFIRKYSRIPVSNAFLAWRIHGPGLAPTEYYRLPVEAAKASVLLLLDSYRLRAHAQVRRRELDAPYHCYLDMFNGLVHPFGVGIFMNVSSPTSVGSRMSSEFRSGRLRMHGGCRENTAFAPAWHEEEEEDGPIEEFPEVELFDSHRQSQSKAIAPLLWSIRLTFGPR